MSRRKLSPQMKRIVFGLSLGVPYFIWFTSMPITRMFYERDEKVKKEVIAQKEVRRAVDVQRLGVILDKPITTIPDENLQEIVSFVGSTIERAKSWTTPSSPDTNNVSPAEQKK